MSNFILHGIVAFSVWRVWKLRWKWAEPNTGTSHLFPTPLPDRPAMPWKNSWSRWFPKPESFEVWFGSWKRNTMTKLPPRRYPSRECHQLFQMTNEDKMPLQEQYHEELASSHLRRGCITSLRTQVQKVDDTYDKCQAVWAKGEVEGFLTDTFLSPNLWYLDPITEHCNTFTLSWHYVFWWSLQNTVPFLCSKVPPWSGSPDQAINLCVHSLYQMAISQESPSICHDISNLLSLVGPGVLQPWAWRWRSGPILVQSIVGFDSKDLSITLGKSNCQDVSF